MSGGGRIVLFGGASEIGLAIVDALVRERLDAGGPAEVVLAGRPTSAHKDAAIAAVEAAGAATVEWLDFDAADPSGHPQLVARVFTRPVSHAIVAFGLLGGARSWRDHAATVRIAQTNFTGALSVGSLLAERFGRQGTGTIIALSSVAGERVRRTNLVYGATKAGMDGFYLQLGVVLAGSGVRVLVVRPGAVVGRMTAGRKVALSTTPEKVAGATLRALARGRAMIRVPRVFTPVQAVYRNLPARLVNRLPF